MLDLAKIKFKHLYAWDCMMASGNGWKADLQELAEKDGAPLNAIYQKREGANEERVWYTFDQVNNENTRARIAALFNTLGWGTP